MSKRRERRIQYAALPFRPGLDGVEVMLITSRETKRWVIPKGWPMPGKSPVEAAAIEAHEEAGIDGAVAETPVGAYSYLKRLKSGKDRPVEVVVYPLRVEALLDDYPEKAERSRQWFAPVVAAALVEEEALKALLLAFGRVRLDEAGDGAKPVA